MDLYVKIRMAPYSSCRGVHVAEQRRIPDTVPKDRVALGEVVEVADCDNSLVVWCQVN